MQFANHAFSLPQIIDSIDAAMQAVHSSLESVTATLGLIQSQRPQAGSDTHQDSHHHDHDIGHAHHADKAQFKRLEKLDIPHEVLRQLKEAGFNLEALTNGELRDAALSYAVDGKVIDDPEDSTLAGKLNRTTHEIESREEKKSFEPIDPSTVESFTSMVKRRKRVQVEIKAPDAAAESLIKDPLSFRALVEESREQAQSSHSIDSPR